MGATQTERTDRFLSIELGEELQQYEILKYSRQLILPEVGTTGQRKLKAARVLIVGAGGLGAPVATYLGAAGVGTLGIVDFDHVDASNLHRQVLFDNDNIGEAKIDVVRRKIEAQNPHVNVECHAMMLSPETALDVVQRYDIVIDATDNFPSRFLINDACVVLKKPCVSASIYRFEGQVSVYWAGHGPCYRCLYPESPPDGLVPSCAEGGVIGVLPGILGTLQANEVIKLLLGIGEPLLGRLLTIDALGMKFSEYALEASADCPMCSAKGNACLLPDYQESCGVIPLPTANNVDASREISVHDLRNMLDREPDIFLLDVRNKSEYELVNIAQSRLIPLDELEDRLIELPKSRTIVCYCHSGKRSRRASDLLQARGFAQTLSLAGGIDAWSREIDTGMVRY